MTIRISYVRNMSKAVWLCLGAGAGALGCGHGADISEIEGRRELLENVELKPDGNGGYQRRVFFQTPAQRAREFQVRAERARYFEEGLEPAEIASEAELSNDVSCTDFYALWVFPQVDQAGARCCISGTGTGSIGATDAGGGAPLNCGYSTIRSLYAGNRGGTAKCSPAVVFSAYQQNNALPCGAASVTVNP
jgi:hypothetical protein